MSTLIIAEKPSVAADIARVLGASKNGMLHEGPGLVVASARGHLVSIDCPDDPGFNLDALPVIPKRWGLKPYSDVGPLLKLLKSAINRSDVTEVVNACDAGREGELIFRLVAEYLSCRKPCTRMWLQSMTQQGIERAWKERKPASEFDALGAAARARSEADWVIGVNATRVLTKSNAVAPGELVSAGRVQTPTLALIVDRELALEQFEPRTFWEVEACFRVAAGEWRARWVNRAAKAGDSPSRLFDRSAAAQIKQRVTGAVTTNISDTAEQERAKPPLPFDLTALQKEANRVAGLSAASTLTAAQRLYEIHKMTTYPRTDSAYLPSDYVETARQVLEHLRPASFGMYVDQALTGAVQQHRVFNDRKISDHFAIVPTGRIVELQGDDAVVYDLIARRFIAAFHPDQVTSKVIRIARVGVDEFQTTVRTVLEAGWTQVVKQRRDDEAQSLCKLVSGESARVIEAVVHEGQTTPPERYTEAALLAAMETAGRRVDAGDLAEEAREAGLGTPATRASVIEELLSERKGYLTRSKRYLVPTSKARALIGTLRANGAEALASPEMTARWEQELHLVEQGKRAAAEFTEGIGRVARSVVDAIRSKAIPSSLPAASGVKLPCRCEKGELADQGKRWRCSSCALTLWKEVAQKSLSEAQISELVAKGETGVIEGFKSRQGRAFAAALRLTAAGKVEFQFQ